jgi:hypothetical protein
MFKDSDMIMQGGVGMNQTKELEALTEEFKYFLN